MPSTRLILSVATTSDSKGGATFTLQTTEQGYVYEGSVQIPNSPSGALFVAKVLGTFWGQWAGPTNFGPVQTWGGEFLTVTATGLTPNTSFTMTFTGVEKTEESAEPIPPAAPTSVVTVETATVIVNNLTITQNAVVVFTPPSLTRRLTIIIDSRGQTSNSVIIALVGNTTNANYYSNFSFALANSNAPFYVAIEPAVDATYSLVFGAFGAGSMQLWVLASETNPLVEGNPNTPVPVTPGSQTLFFGYPPTNLHASLTAFSSGTATQLIGNPSSGLFNFLGTVSVRSNGGPCLVKLSDGSGVFYEIFVNSFESVEHNVEFYSSGQIFAAYVGGATCDIFATYGSTKVA